MNKFTPPLSVVLSALLTNEDAVLDLDFSGRGAFVFYKNFIAEREFVQTSREISGQLVAETMFHSCWGTHIENLGVLEAITMKSNWHTRKELETVYHNPKGDGSKLVKFKAIAFKYVTKMAAAQQTRLTTGSNKQLIGGMVFGGKRKRMVTDELFEIMEKSGPGYVPDCTPAKMITMLRKLYEDTLCEVFSH